MSPNRAPVAPSGAGWERLGVRHGEIDGHDATVVFYGKGSRRLAYVIVSGSGLPRPSGGESQLRRVASPISTHVCVPIDDTMQVVSQALKKA